VTVQANPQQQAQYDKFVENGMRLIYDKKGVKRIVESLDGAGNPVEGLASTLAGVARRLIDSAEKNGVQFSTDVMLHGTGELAEQLANLSAESGGHKYTEDELESVLAPIVHGVMRGGAGGQPPQPSLPQRELMA
jgi:hypothetical protein